MSIFHNNQPFEHILHVLSFLSFRCFFVLLKGLLTDDKTLAGALWRHVYSKECDNPYHLERMIQYIRTQVRMIALLLLHLFRYDDYTVCCFNNEVNISNGKLFPFLSPIFPLDHCFCLLSLWEISLTSPSASSSSSSSRRQRPSKTCVVCPSEFRSLS